MYTPTPQSHSTCQSLFAQQYILYHNLFATRQSNNPFLSSHLHFHNPFAHLQFICSSTIHLLLHNSFAPPQFICLTTIHLLHHNSFAPPQSTCSSTIHLLHSSPHLLHHNPHLLHSSDLQLYKETLIDLLIAKSEQSVEGVQIREDINGPKVCVCFCV